MQPQEKGKQKFYKEKRIKWLNGILIIIGKMNYQKVTY